MRSVADLMGTARGQAAAAHTDRKQSGSDPGGGDRARVSNSAAPMHSADALTATGGRVEAEADRRPGAAGLAAGAEPGSEGWTEAQVRFHSICDIISFGLRLTSWLQANAAFRSLVQAVLL